MQQAVRAAMDHYLLRSVSGREALMSIGVVGTIMSRVREQELEWELERGDRLGNTRINVITAAVEETEAAVEAEAEV